MKKIYLLGMAILTIVAGACTNDLGQASDTERTAHTLIVSMEQHNTNSRSFVGTNCEILWATGDRIYVYDTADKAFDTYSLTAGQGTSTGTFGFAYVSGESLSNTPGYTQVIYPAGNHTISDDDVVTVNLPATYDYSNATTYTANTHAIMLGEYNSSDISLRHLGGVVYVPVQSIPTGVTGMRLKINNSKGVTGNFTVANGCINEVTDSENSRNQIDILIPTTTSICNLDFYFPVPCGQYSFSLYYLTSGSGETHKENLIIEGNKVNTVNRATLLSMPVSTVTTIETSSSEASSKLEETVEGATDPAIMVNVTDNTSGYTSEVTIPEEFTSEQTTQSELTLNYAAVPSTITITEESNAGTTTATDSKGNMTVAIPTTSDSGTGTTVSEMTITTPRLTATLEAVETSENSILPITKLTATTANNTLYIGDNVSIGELIINGGNLVINPGASVTTLDVKSGVHIFVYDARESGKLTGTDVTTTSGGTYTVVSSLAELAYRSAIYNQSKYCKLEGNLDLTGENVTLPDNFTLDLGGYTFKAKQLAWTNACDVTIQNGTFELTENCLFLLAKDSKLTVDGVKVISAGSAAFCIGGQQGDVVGGCTVNITSSEIETKENGSGILLYGPDNKLSVVNSTIKHKWFGITQQGSFSPGSTVDLSGTTITGTYSGIYLSNQAAGGTNTLSVNGCNITSTDESAIEVKKTDLTVINSTLGSEATTQSYAVSGGGSNGVGYAIVLAKYAAGVPYSGNVTLTNNTYNIAAPDGEPIYYGDCIQTGENTYNVYTAKGMQEVCALTAVATSPGKKVTLMKDIDLTPMTTSTTVTANDFITLDLAGHTVKADETNGNIKVLGKLYINDSSSPSAGKIVSTATGNQGVIRAENTAYFRINGGTIDAPNGYALANSGGTADGYPSMLLVGGTINGSLSRSGSSAWGVYNINYTGPYAAWMVNFVNENSTAYLNQTSDYEIENSFMYLKSTTAIVNLDLGDNTLTFNPDATTNPFGAYSTGTLNISNGNVVLKENTKFGFVSINEAGSLYLNNVKTTGSSLELEGRNSYTVYVQSGGKFTASNSTFDVTNYASLNGYNAGLIELNKSTFSGGIYGIVSVPETGDVTITDCTITSNAMGLTTNAALTNQEHKFIIKGTTFNAPSPVMINVECNSEFDGCTFNGTAHGMVMRGGTYKVNNTTITLDVSEYTDEASATDAAAKYITWGQGNQMRSAGIVLGNKDSDAYQYATTSTFTDVDVIVKGTYASKFPMVYANGNEGEKGVTFNYDEASTFRYTTDGSTYTDADATDFVYGNTNVWVNEKQITDEQVEQISTTPPVEASADTKATRSVGQAPDSHIPAPEVIAVPKVKTITLPNGLSATFIDGK